MTKKNQTTSPEPDAQAPQPPQPNPTLRSLDRLAGTRIADNEASVTD
jgi:hypothetical protein